MSIIVTCPGCHKSFSVKDEFGGRKGPCPKCKTIITIPMPDKKVTVHGGDAFETGGKNAAGKLVLKPITRRETLFKPKTFAIVAGSTLLVFLLAWLLGGLMQKFGILAYLGLILVTPPLVYAPWFFLRDTEAIEDLSHSELMFRTAIVSVLYIAFWTVYIFFAPSLAEAFGSLFSYMTWPFAALPLLLVGGLAASYLFDLETGDGYVHTVFYAAVTAALFWTAGLTLLPAGESATPLTPPAGQESVTTENSASVESTDQEKNTDQEKGKKSKKSKKNKKEKNAKKEITEPPLMMKNGKPVDPRSR